MADQYINVRCRIKASDPDLRHKAGTVAYKDNQSSGYDFLTARCVDCGIDWSILGREDIDATLSCSNCYGENVHIVQLRLWFPDYRAWMTGEGNSE